MLLASMPFWKPCYAETCCYGDCCEVTKVVLLALKMHCVSESASSQTLVRYFNIQLWAWINLTSLVQSNIQGMPGITLTSCLHSPAQNYVQAAETSSPSRPDNGKIGTLNEYTVHQKYCAVYFFTTQKKY